MYVKYFTSFYVIKYKMELAKKIGQNIAYARKSKGLTQAQVAKRLHMTQQQYSRFENGVFELNYKQICEICTA